MNQLALAIKKIAILTLLLGVIFFDSVGRASAGITVNELKPVDGGEYSPNLFKGKTVKVESFKIQEHAVTNRDFLAFVSAHPQWRRGKVKAIFADDSYLAKWKSELDIGDASLEEAPVVHVSWFAAKAYCESLSLRLPTQQEWEYVGQFGPQGSKAGPKDLILEWYSKPTPEKIKPVRSTFKNKFGVWDMHGLIWEWVQDFNSSFVIGESRDDAALEKSMFCGGGAIGVADPSDTAAFMRFGFRSSLKGNYTVANLGFRCAKNQNGGEVK